ncbi:MAG TPA: ATP-grasp domain-containing protein [Bacteroidales bacterium]|nr:ATP-grasp domain-containing protein [Bacteroidales bacterium]HRZ49913.1 ATP-grasp domain-containing protein [Bacteroidales bacterium]
MKKTKRFLLLGASEEMLPLIRLAQAEGYAVIATDRNPEAPGLKTADHPFCMDASELPATWKLAREWKPCAITTRTELLLPVVASVCHELQLPGPDKTCAELSVDKYRFRETMQRAGIRTPRFASPENEAALLETLASIGLPAIIKPVDFSGSTGVSLIRTSEDAVPAFLRARNASPAGWVILEEFVNGKEISVETWSQHGKIHFVAFTDKQVSGNGHFVELRHTIPSALSLTEQRLVMGEVEKMAAAMNLNDTIAHTEVILSENGPVIVETGARPGGDHIAFRLVPLATGIDMYRIMFQLAAGIEVPSHTPTAKAAAIQYSTSENYQYIDKIHQSVISDDNFVEYIEHFSHKPEKLTCSADRSGAWLFAAPGAASLAKSLRIFEGL